MVREETDTTSRPDHLRPELSRGMSKNGRLREKRKWAIEEPKLDNARGSRGIYFIDPEDMEFKEIIFLTIKNWKHQLLPLCLAILARRVSMGKPIARLTISSLNLHVSWKPVNPQECVWKKLYRNIMRTISQEKETIHCSITIYRTQIYSHASRNEDTRSKSSSGLRMGETGKDSRVGPDESQKQIRGDR